MWRGDLLLIMGGTQEERLGVGHAPDRGHVGSQSSMLAVLKELAGEREGPLKTGTHPAMNGQEVVVWD